MTDYEPVIDNILIEQGTTYARAYPVTGPVMAGATAKAQVRATPASGVVLAEFDVDVSVTGTTEATVTLSLTPEATWAMSWAAGYWDGVLTAADGTVSRFARGTAEFSPGVTR